MFFYALQNIIKIRYIFLTSFYQRASANLPPKHFDNDLNFSSFVQDFNIFAHFVMKNWIKSNGKRSNCVKPMQNQKYVIYLSLKSAKALIQTFLRPKWYLAANNSP